MENTYPIAKRIKPEKEIVDFETSRKANEDAQKRSDNTYQVSKQLSKQMVSNNTNEIINQTKKWKLKH